MSIPASVPAFDLDNPLDDGGTLAKWGFEKNYCFKCNKHNSELDGLLMQCGKCKKAYYCGMKCFNADLVEHQKVCCTEKFEHRDPDRTRASEMPDMSSIVSASSLAKKKKSKGSDRSVSSKTSKTSKKKKSGDKKRGKGDSEDGTKGGKSTFSIADIAFEGNEENDEENIGEKGGTGCRTDMNTSEISLDFDPNSSVRSAGDVLSIGVVDDDSSEYEEDEDGVRRKVMGRSTIRPEDQSSSTTLGRSFTVGVDYVEADAEVRAKREELKRRAEQEKRFLELAHNSLSNVVINEDKKEPAWEKPAWVKETERLRKTQNGQKLREGVDVVRPISKGIDQTEH